MIPLKQFCCNNRNFWSLIIIEKYKQAPSLLLKSTPSLYGWSPESYSALASPFFQRCWASCILGVRNVLTPFTHWLHSQSEFWLVPLMKVKNLPAYLRISNELFHWLVSCLFFTTQFHDYFQILQANKKKWVINLKIFVWKRWFLEY